MSIRQRVHDLPDAEKQRYDLIVDEFDDSWSGHPDTPPSIDGRLPRDEPLRRLVLVALIKTDLECRLKRREPMTAEDYFRAYPELDDDADARGALAAWERELLFEEK